MLIVTIDLVSALDGSRRTLGRMLIWNRGTGTSKRRNYGVNVLNKRKLNVSELKYAEDGATRLGEVNNYPAESYNVWRLVCRALKSAFPEEAHSKE